MELPMYERDTNKPLPTPPIGLVGPAGVGKDALCQDLIEYVTILGFHRRVAFADRLKQMAAALYGLDYHDEFVELLMHEKEVVMDFLDNKSPRQVLQELGVALRESYDVDVWLKVVKQELTKDPKGIITDVRFQNEVDLIRKDFQGLIIRLNRKGLNKVRSHKSEELAHNSDFKPDLDIELPSEPDEHKRFYKYRKEAFWQVHDLVENWQLERWPVELLDYKEIHAVSNIPRTVR